MHSFMFCDDDDVDELRSYDGLVVVFQFENKFIVFRDKSAASDDDDDDELSMSRSLRARLNLRTFGSCA